MLSRMIWRRPAGSAIPQASMGLIIDTSLFIAGERGRFDMPGFLRHTIGGQPAIAAVTASELLHGVERADDAARRSRRSHHVEQLLASCVILPFNLAAARIHARLWAELESRGMMIGPHDMQIAATALAQGFDLATLNAREFQRIPRLRVVDATPFVTG